MKHLQFSEREAEIVAAKLLQKCSWVTVEKTD